MNNNCYQPEYNLLADAYLGSREVLKKKLDYLAKISQDEIWDYKTSSDKAILFNYLCYTYDRVKTENKISLNDSADMMCFNTGLLTEHGANIYALFVKNASPYKKENQNWFLSGFKQESDKDMRSFINFPDIADYFTNPSDFIYDKKLSLSVDWDHIIDDNFDRFKEIGLSEKYIIGALSENAVSKILDKVKRNYKLAIPQYYTDKQTKVSKIQLLLPLFLQNKDVADLVLVVDKDASGYVGKTILTIEWAYVNSRRIVKPEVDWLKI